MAIEGNGRLRVDLKYVVAIVTAMAAMISYLVVDACAAGREARQQIIVNQSQILKNQGTISESQAKLAVVLDALDRRQTAQNERLSLEISLLREQLKAHGTR
jgi:hypothetical protein